MNTKRSFRQTNHKVHRTVPTFFIFLLITTGCLTVAANITNAATYHVDDTNGNDSDSGTSEQPWKTLSKAQSTVAGGDTVIVRDGSYSSYSENDIVRTDWVTYKAAVGHTPVLSGISVTQTNLNNSYLIFDGLKITTTGTGIQPTRVRYLQLLNLTIEGSRDTLAYYNSNYPGIKLWQACKDITIDNCTIKSSSVTFGRFGFTSGVYIQGGNNITVTNCDISGSSQAIYAEGNNINISNNNLHNFNSDGIIVYDVNTLLIQNNTIHDIFIYEPNLAEDPCTTTWSADGKTMFNSNAKWATAGDNLITTNMEVYVKSGTNVYLNDGESTVGNFTVSSIDPNGMSITLAKGIANGGQPSNVDYFIRAAFHADNIQVQANPGVNNYNVTISKNRLYDNRGLTIGSTIGGGQIMHIWPQNTSDPNDIGAYNILVENNLIWSDCNSYSGGEEYYRTVNLRSTDGLIFRNNTVIGRVAIAGGTGTAKLNKNVQCYGNIISYIDIFADSGLIKNNYNIMNRGFILSPFSAGANDTFFHPNAYATGNWKDPNYTGLFKNYDANDFNLVSGSLAIGHGDPTNYPATDILGVARKSTPDAGCYEYAPVVLSFAPIGNKEVNEGSTLTFNIDINDLNVKTSIEEHNLPSEPNFINNIFSWTSAYEDAGSYEATFVAQNDLFEDFETIGIYVNNVNRSPVLAAISDKSVDENSLLNFLVSATDSDGDSITYSAANLPSEATFAGQTFNWTPDYNQSGTYQVTFTATDGQAQDWQTVNLTVNDVAAYVGTDAGTLLLNENFDRRSLADWLIIDEGKSCRSSWYAATRTLVQKSSIYTLSFPNQPGTYALYKNGSEWTNYQVSLTMKSGDSDSLGVMFRYKDSNNYYRFSWDKRRKTRQLVKNCDGIFTVLCRDSVPYLAGRYYQVNIIANGPDLQVLINNSPVLQTTDSSISSGSIAMYSWANSGSYFDNIVVRKF